MTSRHLFFKAMIEDLRHRIWMIALSVLANFLLLPVAWLVQRNNMRSLSYLEFYDNKYYYVQTMSYLKDYLPFAGGIIAIVGALIVGLFGFRYVFHKKMIDTYHSIPIKRSTLYGVCWLNGVLIWLVPFLTGYTVTLAMIFSYARNLFDSDFTSALLFQTAFVSLLVVAVAFFLVYHLVLTAVMVSGNVLNTLVSMMIMGFGAISIYALVIGFFAFYMSTFYSGNIPVEPGFYLSPFMSAIYLLYLRAQNEYSGLKGLGLPILINVGMAVLLGCAAWLLYKKRASELAEQGIRNKALSAVFRILVGVAAGMGGWMFFTLLTSKDAVSWGIFGALFAGILVFGVMDIIFNMDFKAFFAHKIQMAAASVFCLLVCFSLYGDWYGYDTYLPDKEQVAEISIADYTYSNRRSYYSYGGEEAWLDMTHIQDVDAAYDYLEEMAAREGRGYIITDDEITHYFKRLLTRVTLKNGKTYYRYYSVTDLDLDMVCTLLSDPGYLEANYLLDGQWASLFDVIAFHRLDQYYQTIAVDPETVAALMEAYNKDVLKNPETVILHQGTMLARLELERTVGYPPLYGEGGPEVYRVFLEVYDGMENTIEALERMGYGEWVAKKSADEIDEIQLYVYGRLDVYETVQQVMDDACERYGIPIDTVDPEGSTYPDMLEGKGDTIAESPYQVPYYENQLAVIITDKAEIRELLELVNYEEPYNVDNVLTKSYTQIHIKDADGSEYYYYLKRGDLPVKYILRFGQMFEQLKQQ